MPQFNPEDPRREEYDADHRSLRQEIAAVAAQIGTGTGTSARRTPGTIVAAPRPAPSGTSSAAAPSASLPGVSDGTTTFASVPLFIFADGWTITQDPATGAAMIRIIGIDDSP